MSRMKDLEKFEEMVKGVSLDEKLKVLNNMTEEKLKIYFSKINRNIYKIYSLDVKEEQIKLSAKLITGSIHKQLDSKTPKFMVDEDLLIIIEGNKFKVYTEGSSLAINDTLFSLVVLIEEGLINLTSEENLKLIKLIQLFNVNSDLSLLSLEEMCCEEKSCKKNNKNLKLKNELSKLVKETRKKQLQTDIIHDFYTMLLKEDIISIINDLDEEDLFAFTLSFLPIAINKVEKTMYDDTSYTIAVEEIFSYADKIETSWLSVLIEVNEGLLNFSIEDDIPVDLEWSENLEPIIWLLGYKGYISQETYKRYMEQLYLLEL